MTVLQREQPFDGRLWGRWVAANAFGELIGLGLAALIGIGLAAVFGPDPTAGISLGLAAVAVALGTFEGAVVGVAQWMVLRDVLPGLTLRAWALATAAGGFLAWTLGMLPSTLMDFTTEAGTAASYEPPFLLQMGMAMAMGAVVGPVLGIGQWVVLRKHVQRAALWIPANALAWALAMPLTFIAAGSSLTGVTLIVMALGMVLTAGAIVGAVHGLFLERLVKNLI